MKVLFNIVPVLLLTGCGAQQIANTKQLDDSALQKANATQLSPAQVCDEAGKQIARGDSEALRFYAPLHMKQAIDNLENGQKQIKITESTTSGMQACYKASELITGGMAIKSKAQDMLKDALDEYDMLKQVDHAKKFADDIQDHREDIQDLIKQIEAGKIDDALKGQASLIRDMQELEIDIVLDYNLKPAEAMLDKAEDADADDLAEKTFEKAEQELDSARKFITANYRNYDEIAKTSALAMRAARHAYHVAVEVESLKELKPEAAEEKVLYIESLLENINRKFNQDVVIGHSMYDQADLISKRLDKLISENLALDKQITALRSTTPAAEPLADTADDARVTPLTEATSNDSDNDRLNNTVASDNETVIDDAEQATAVASVTEDMISTDSAIENAASGTATTEAAISDAIDSDATDVMPDAETTMPAEPVVTEEHPAPVAAD